MNNSTLPVFDGTDYHLWREQLKFHFVLKKLWKHIENPVTPNNPEDKMQWIEDDQSAHAIIGLSLVPRLVPIISDATSAKEAWDKLANIYESKNKEAQLILLKELFTKQLTSTENINESKNKEAQLILLKELFTKQLTSTENIIEHITEIRSLADRINRADCDTQTCTCGKKTKTGTVTEAVVSTIVLNSLPKTYASFVSSFLARQGNTNLEQLSADLIAESNRQESSPLSETSAVYSIQKNNPPFCEYCKRLYHTEKWCKKKKMDENFASQQRLNTFFSSQEDESGNFCFNATNTKLLTGLVVDSGATRHVTNDLSLLDNIRSVDKTTITVGNGNIIEIDRMGDIKLLTYGRQITLKDVRYSPNFSGTFISESCLLRPNCTIKKKGNKMSLIYEEKEILTALLRNDGLWYLSNCHLMKQESLHVMNTSSPSLDHYRLGHTSQKTIHALFKGLNKARSQYFCFCPICAMH